MKIGIDIGGTFTDIVLIDPETNRVEVLKVPSTSNQLEQGVIDGLKRLQLRLKEKFRYESVIQLVHGTTVATNAILERNWAVTALITTEGFRDVLEIGRQNRPELYNLLTERPDPIVPRDLRFEVPERLDYRGEIIHELDEGQLDEIAEVLNQRGVDSVAVSFLFSYLNPEHERRVKAALRRSISVPITLSCEVLPEFREYERTSTTAISAALKPVVDRYLKRLEERTRALGIARDWRIMRSNAGISSSQIARHNPATIVLSGPAAGVEGAKFVGKLAGFNDLITLDMGGTSCDLSLIVDGKPTITNEGEIDGRPLRIPMVDIHTIGAGGGSIAWRDAGGALRVGPRSAGADPGPVCYGKGGGEPTVTDAHLVLGRLNPEHPLGGMDRLDLDAAQQVIEERIATPLGMELEVAAQGILDVADAAMERAIRVISVERGYDPRDFVLLAFGGAGPLHAGHLADKLEIPTVIIPNSAGVLSSLGLLAADLVHHFVQSILRRVEDLDLDLTNDIYRRFKRAGRQTLKEGGVTDPGRISFLPSLDLRYQGQSYELNLPLPNRELSPDDLSEIAARFDEAHRMSYGYAAPGEPLEVVNLRLEARGEIPKPLLREMERTGSRRLKRAETPPRDVYFRETGWVLCKIFSRDRLPVDVPIPGPAIIEGTESTVTVFPGQRARMDPLGDLIIEREVRTRA
ncbi:MAG: hydantoinase/oxoprolinase family protein [Candidatus Bipolaricaulia bacterium]